MKHLYILCGVIAAIAGTIFFMPAPDRDSKISEDELAKLVPVELMGQRFETGTGGADATYRMDDESYKVLEYPSAICRQFDIEGDLYDVVVIASRSKDAFHDPNICFAAQQWSIEKRTPTTIETKSRGEMPLTVISMFNKETRRQLAAYIYKGPGGFYSDTNRLKLAFLKEELMLGNNLEGVFYRFIPYFKDKDMPEAEQQAKLKAFVSNFVDETYKTSAGVL